MKTIFLEILSLLNVLPSPLCVVCVLCLWRPWKRLELESLMALSRHEGAGNRARILCQSNKCSRLLSHLSNSSNI